ncbi:TIGR01906 family membrane protein [Companilactobacillus metriopterae]|uniref:TIGR01906 family membrane protein n=1 Tax=Companilactobacillus metriopterae TaxID=1909267 RepID=UPI00100BEB19|nr:TIGR01906 family membrane protein [Companilactobacillus metriopterae]
MSSTQKDTVYTIASILFLFTLSITLAIVVSFAFFRYDIGAYYLSDEVHLTSQQLMHNYNQMLNYLVNPFAHNFKLDNFPSSASGIRHFSDCKNLFMLNFIVMIFTGIYYFVQRKVRAVFPKVYLYTAGVFIILAILMTVNFDGFFVIFHEILFRNSDWLFDPNLDPIINVLPEEFFTQCFVFFFVLFEGLLLYKYWQTKRART